MSSTSATSAAGKYVRTCNRPVQAPAPAYTKVYAATDTHSTYPMSKHACQVLVRPAHFSNLAYCYAWASSHVYTCMNQKHRFRSVVLKIAICIARRSPRALSHTSRSAHTQQCKLKSSCYSQPPVPIGPSQQAKMSVCLQAAKT